MKILITSFLICIACSSFSQSKELVILDNNSKKPIDLVSVFYPSLQIGSISNADGKVKIPLLENDIIASHISYIEKKFTFDYFKQKDTLFLIPKTNQLDEVVIYNLDLKQKFKDIFKTRYFQKYSTKKVIHNCTYKETFTVNGSLSRLFQAQLDWFSKNSLFKANSAIDKQNIINLKAVDYSKIIALDNSLPSSKSAYIDNKSFFQFAHLNLLLELLVNLTEDYEIESIQKNESTTIVYFNATLKQNGKILYKHKNSLIVFDKDYKAIKQLKFNMIYETDFEDRISKTFNIPYKNKTESHIIELSFHPVKSGQYSISYYISKLNGIIKTENNTEKIISEQSLFVTDSRLGDKLTKGNIDLNKPFYQNIPPSLKINDIKILLTENEKDFLEQ
jgi:hypothetical protein